MTDAYNSPFPVTIATIRKGALVNELTEELARVVAGVMQFEKAGELTLKLKVKPAAQNSEMVVIEDELIVKEPKADRPPTWFFATDDGGLTRENPDQPDLPFPRPVASTEQS